VLDCMDCLGGMVDDGEGSSSDEISNTDPKTTVGFPLALRRLRADFRLKCRAPLGSSSLSERTIISCLDSNGCMAVLDATTLEDRMTGIVSAFRSAT
jgi:hypothetical protein